MAFPLITTQINPPLLSDTPEQFNVKAFDSWVKLSQLSPQLNVWSLEADKIGNQVSSSASAAKSSETKAKTSELNSLVNAQNAAASNNAPKWVSGTTYTEGKLAWSPITGRIYKRLITGAGTTDPSNDTANWVLLSVVAEQTDIGNSANNFPLNQNLGGMAFQSPEAVVIRPAASANPLNLNDLVFELTSNTSLKLKVKGSDGVVRTVTLTLA